MATKDTVYRGTRLRKLSQLGVVSRTRTKLKFGFRERQETDRQTEKRERDRKRERQTDRQRGSAIKDHCVITKNIFDNYVNISKYVN